MSTAILPRRSLIKPGAARRLNRAGPWARQLVGAWAMLESGGSQLQDLTGVSPGSLSGTYTWVDGPLGRALSLAGGSASVPANTRLSITGNFALLVWFRTTNAGAQVLLGFYGGSPNPGYGLATGINSAGQAAVWLGGASGAWFSMGANLADGKWHAVCTMLSGTTLFLVIDGQPALVTTVSITPGTYTGVRALGAASAAAGGGAAFSGQLGLAAVWSRTLTTREARILTRRPLELLAPVSLLPFVAVLGGATLAGQAFLAPAAMATVQLTATAALVSTGSASGGTIVIGGAGFAGEAALRASGGIPLVVNVTVALISGGAAAGTVVFSASALAALVSGGTAAGRTVVFGGAALRGEAMLAISGPVGVSQQLRAAAGAGFLANLSGAAGFAMRCGLRVAMAETSTVSAALPLSVGLAARARAAVDAPLALAARLGTRTSLALAREQTSGLSATVALGAGFAPGVWHTNLLAPRLALRLGIAEGGIGAVTFARTSPATATEGLGLRAGLLVHFAASLARRVDLVTTADPALVAVTTRLALHVVSLAAPAIVRSGLAAHGPLSATFVTDAPEHIAIEYPLRGALEGGSMFVEPASLTLYRGARDSLLFTLYDDDLAGNPRHAITTETVTCRIRRDGAWRNVFPATQTACVVVDAADGVVRYDLPTGLPQTGSYRAQLVLVGADGGQDFGPEITITVLEGL